VSPAPNLWRREVVASDRAEKLLRNVQPKAEVNVERLPTKIAQGIIDTIIQMLFSENSLTLPNVIKVQGSDNLWRRRKGDYRILFSLDTDPVVVDGIHYKGWLVIVTVRKRDESTYR
jgi:mRNA-degrading endonuclease RelE of RelBE toxin-antitoxin system